MGEFVEDSKSYSIRVHWLNGGGKPKDTIKNFFLDLSRMSGTGNGIGASTIAKLKAFAKEYGYL